MQLRMEIVLLTKQFTAMNSKKVNFVGSQGKAPKLYDFDIEEEVK